MEIIEAFGLHHSCQTAAFVISVYYRVFCASFVIVKDCHGAGMFRDHRISEYVGAMTSYVPATNVHTQF